MRLAVAFTLMSAAAVAQLPDGKTLIDQAQAKAKSFHSLQFLAENTVETAFPGTPVKMTVESSSAYLNPGKARMEVRIAGLIMLDVSDGATTWIYNSALKQYTKIAAAQGPSAIMSALGVKLPDVSSVKTSYRTTGQETIEIDGQKHDCWVVAVQIGEMTLPSADKSIPKMTGATMTWWVDKKLGLDLKSTMAMKMTIGGKDIEMHQTTIKKNLQIDQPVDEALFTFTPPADSKEVKELKMFGAVAAKPELAGQDAPAFELKSIDGKSYSLAALKGRPVLLDFWATWCEPCRASLPAMEKIAKESKGDLVILGVNSGEDREIVGKFLTKTPFVYPAVLSADSGILEAYQVTAFPTFILIGRDGKIVDNQIGFAGEDSLRELIGKAK